MNATVEGDHIRLLPDIHIGIATAVEEGLLVPVVRDADGKSLGQIAAESALWSNGCASGEFGVDQVSGGTFTVTSLGGLGIDAFTPIINPPEVAILGVGRIVDQPGAGGRPIGVAKGDDPEPDHRPPGRRRLTRSSLPGHVHPARDPAEWRAGGRRRRAVELRTAHRLGAATPPTLPE